MCPYTLDAVLRRLFWKTQQVVCDSPVTSMSEWNRRSRIIQKKLEMLVPEFTEAMNRTANKAHHKKKKETAHRLWEDAWNTTV